MKTSKSPAMQFWFQAFKNLLRDTHLYLRVRFGSLFQRDPETKQKLLLSIKQRIRLNGWQIVRGPVISLEEGLNSILSQCGLVGFDNTDEFDWWTRELTRLEAVTKELKK